MIRRLIPPDPERLVRLAAVHGRAFAADARGWSDEEICSLAQTGALFADDQNTGFALFSLAQDEAELLTIAVDPTRQRNGLARRMLSIAERALTDLGVTVIHLEVAADNAAAIGLYLSLGYEMSGKRPKYYRRADGARVDALMMIKRL